MENAANDDDMTKDAERREADRRRRLLKTTLVLLIGLPLYLVFASYVVGGLTAPTIVDGEPVKPVHWLVELAIYVVLGAVWAFPLKGLVQGLGRS